MLGKLYDGQEARANSDSLSSSLDDPRLAAWSILTREQRRAYAGVRRLHRGMLPDVDMSNVVVDPNHRPLTLRLVSAVRRLFPRRGAIRGAANMMSGDGDENVAESGQTAYIEPDHWKRVAAGPGAKQFRAA